MSKQFRKENMAPLPPLAFRINVLFDILSSSFIRIKINYPNKILFTLTLVVFFRVSALNDFSLKEENEIKDVDRLLGFQHGYYLSTSEHIYFKTINLVLCSIQK